jgi:hypothetical protein
LRRNEAVQNFNIWVHGDDKLVRGSGLFVGETGVAANHHFLTPRDGNAFQFVQGRYRLEVYAHLLGDKEANLLFRKSSKLFQKLRLNSRSREQVSTSTGGQTPHAT